jgi:hypothetical protein
METLLVTAHVLAAVLAIGPLVWAPFAARRAIVRRDAGGVRAARGQLTVFGLGSLVTAGLGVLALTRSTAFGFGTPWVVVSMTLYVIALALVYAYAIPALRRAGHLVQEGVPARPEAEGEEGEAGTTLTATAAHLRAKERLDAISARIGGAGLLVLFVFAVIVVMMTAKPF